MPGIVIVGAQWGDEGKGKITDLLAERADLVVRYQGGNNAGHTVVVGNENFKFHLLPSGVVQNKEVRIASGVVIDPRVLVQELDTLEKRGITPRLRIDPRAHVILPVHNALDEAREAAAGEGKLGTTGRGIGPCYEDRASRAGIRFEDLVDEARFRRKVIPLLEAKAQLLGKVYQRKGPAQEDIVKEYVDLGRRLAGTLGDVSEEVHSALQTDGRVVLFEGAQGTLLDLAFGTYPYVTSSHPLSGSVFVNVGLPPSPLEVIGVSKAYTTRVGSGPFPTELDGKVADRIREVGKEYGTTTGRPRRCGWLDLVMLKYAHRLNGFSQLALTKLDVLSGFKKLRIATSYRYDGVEIGWPYDIEVLSKVEPVYEELDGFTLGRTDSYEDLPEEAQEYIAFIERTLEVPVTIVSVGPARQQTLFKSKPL